MFLSCPKQELLLEFVTIRGEVSLLNRMTIRAHKLGCNTCREKIQSITESWDAYFRPEPDITNSLIKVFSRLQQDETLILKGWKLSEAPRSRTIGDVLLREGWLFRGGVTAGLAVVVTLFVVNRFQPEGVSSFPAGMPLAETSKVPSAQIRFQDRNAVRVHYVQPELLQTIEFETMTR